MNQLIQKNIPLHDKNWFRTGGPAEFYCAPRTAAEFQEAVRWAAHNQTSITLLGEGANVLIHDAGCKGLVIQPHVTTIHHELQGNVVLVTAGAGVSFGNAITYCLDNNIIGLEEFSGIPGSVGGSVFINIHYFEFLLSNFLVSAQVIHRLTGEILTVDSSWFNFGYNYSRLHEQEYFLLSATFQLKRVSDIEAAYARGRSVEIIRHRAQRYPKSHTCGSFFRNFFPAEVTYESAGKKMIYVAYYLDKIGVKGHLSVGDAIVSYQHANMLVNRGNATSNDLIALARTMQELVKTNFGIIPQAECRFLGFAEHPLR